MKAFPSSPLPTDPPGATRSVFHIEKLYLSVGDEIDSLLDELDWGYLDAYGDKSPSHLYLLAMVTAFQYAEELSDRAAAVALRERTDWKYALHLPLDYPGIDPGEFVEFRRRLRHDPAGQRVLQRLLDRLSQRGLFGATKTGQILVGDVLRPIEHLTRLDRLAEGMQLALEHLAATHPAWLQANSLPHWVERYAPQGDGDRDRVRQDLADGLTSDVTYLLSAIAESDLPALDQAPEIRTLQALSNELGLEDDNA